MYKLTHRAFIQYILFFSTCIYLIYIVKIKSSRFNFKTKITTQLRNQGERTDRLRKKTTQKRGGQLA